MGEIKFRAWEKSTGRMVSWNDFLNEYCDHLVFILSGQDPHDGMQYTGLKDKNGKEIYEGDIVLNNDNTYQMKDREIVKLIDGGFYPFAILGWECTIDPAICEIIGNIYENPELIAVDKVGTNKKEV